MRVVLTRRVWMIAACTALVAVLIAPIATAADDQAHEDDAAATQHEEAAAEGSHSEEGGGDHGGHEEGVPLSFKTDLAFWSLIVFLVFIGILKKFAWGPIILGLEKREGGIQRQIEEAEAANEKAKALLADYEYKIDKAQEEVREIMAEARRDAEHTRNEMISTAQAESEAMKQRAVTDIERARDDALDQLFSHMSESVAQAAETVIGRSLSDADDKKLIDDALSGFSPSNN